METDEPYILIFNGKEFITQVCQPATTVNDAHNTKQHRILLHT